MSSYAKLIAVVIGMIALTAKQFADIDLGSDFTDKMTDVAIELLTAFAVYKVKNK